LSEYIILLIFNTISKIIFIEDQL